MYKYSSVKWGITKFTVGPMISRFAFANVARSSRDSGTNAIVFAGVGEANVCRKLSKQSWYKLMINSISCHRPLWWHLMHELLINNGNWTEWSAIWPEIICVISKSNESAARVRFEITGMISDQNCTTRSSITTLLQPFWNRRIQSVIWYPVCSKVETKGFNIQFGIQNRNDVI